MEKENAKPETRSCFGHMMSKNKSKIGSNVRRGEYVLGEVAQPSDVADIPLIDIARLHVGDPVWVKRTDKSWTYAIVKEVETGPNASVVITVSKQGEFKKLSMNQCVKFLRRVVNNNDGSLKALGKLGTDANLRHSSTKLSDEVSVDNSTSMLTVLDALESYHSHHNEYAGNMRLRVDFVQRLIGDLDDIRSQDKIKTDCEGSQFCGLAGVEDHRSVSSGGACRRWPESSLSKDTILQCGSSRANKRPQRHVTFKLHQDGNPNPFRVSDDRTSKRNAETVKQRNNLIDSTGNEILGRKGILRSGLPQLQRQSSWSMEIRKMAEGILNIPKKKLDDLDMGEILPQSGREMGGDSFHHEPKSIYRRSTSPPPLQHEEHLTKETTHQNAPKSRSIQKKNISELNMGEVVPQTHGQVGFESFQHALRSIHKRSSVFLPPVSGGGVTLH